MRTQEKIVIAGGGVAALESVLALRNLVGADASITVVAPNATLEYRPYSVLLPFGTHVEHQINLSDLFFENGVSQVFSSIRSVNTASGEVVTDKGEEISFDFLILALGCGTADAVPGAITFAGNRSVDEMTQLLRKVTSLEVQRIAFVVPPDTGWPLPLYELATQTRQFLLNNGIDGVELFVVTAEMAPLGIFGQQASESIAELLESNEIELIAGASAKDFRDGTLKIVPERSLEADAVVSLPRAVGRPPEGLGHDGEGFLISDQHGRLIGEQNIFAAGDCTSFPIKQGGLAAQQADAVADSIAQAMGKRLSPRPFRPVLRGSLLAGDHNSYFRSSLVDGVANNRTSISKPLWWPPGKIAGKYLTPYLAKRTGIGFPPSSPDDGLPIEVKFADALRSQHYA